MDPWRGPLPILTLAHVVGTLHMVSVMAMAPVIQHALGLSVGQVGLLVTGYYAAQASGALAAGVLVDRAGVARALLAAHVLLIAGVLTVSRASDLAGALAGTAVMGLGYCIVNPATARGVLLWLPARRRATAMGIKQTGVPIGGVLAAANGALAAVLDWRALLAGLAVLTAAHALICLRLPREAPAPPAARPGGALRALWREPNVRVVFLSSLTWNIGQTNFFAYLTLFLREAMQASQPVAGLGLGLAQAASAIGRIGWGMVSDNLFGGSRKGLTVALCAAGALLLALLAAGPAGGLALALVLAAALGLTVASYASLAQTLAVEAVPPAQAGAAMGYSLTGTSIGGMLGPVLFGAAVDSSGSFTLGWLITAALVAAGTALVAFGFRERRRA